MKTRELIISSFLIVLILNAFLVNAYAFTVKHEYKKPDKDDDDKDEDKADVVVRHWKDDDDEEEAEERYENLDKDELTHSDKSYSDWEYDDEEHPALNDD